ncbi:MAG: hypothetical protein M1839_002201 [Geoglossum umbratile]|nr:MAG: hypothetical protein M1839_002201 [Geoglossum umbratile]
MVPSGALALDNRLQPPPFPPFSTPSLPSLRSLSGGATSIQDDHDTQAVRVSVAPCRFVHREGSSKKYMDRADLGGRQIMTEYSRLRHPSSSESEVSAAAPANPMAQSGKATLNGNRKKKLQRPENQVPTEHINYTQPPMAIERGDWVVRLREGDPASMAKLDESDIWDGPFNVIELPPTSNDEKGNPGEGAAKHEKIVHRVKLRFPPGSMGDPWTVASRLIPVYPEPPRPENAASGARGVVFHLRKGPATHVELQSFRPRGKKGEELYIVGRLRDRRATAGDSGAEYLVHWAGYPSEDDSWEKVGGIPEPFLEEYDRARPEKKTDPGSKTPKAKKERLSAGLIDPPINSATAAHAQHRSPRSSQHASKSANTQEDTTPARRATAGPRTPGLEPRAQGQASGIGAPTPEPSPPTSTPTTPVLGKRNRMRADHQTTPAAAAIGKRRRVAKRASLA